MSSTGSRRVANSLVAMGSAAVLTVYAAGFLRTRAAAQKLAGAEQRRVAPAPAEAGGSASPAFIDPPTAIAGTASTHALPPLKRATTREAKTTLAPKSSTEPASAPVTSAPVTLEPATVPATTVTPAEPAPVPKSIYKDGTYSGWGTSRHGDIQASVVIEDGRVVNASITQCLTRYSCSWIAHLPPQIVSRQSPECDYVSGATQSTNAFYYAIVEALSKAK